MGIKFLYSLLKREFAHIYSSSWDNKPVELLCIDLNNMIHICTQEKYGYGMYASSLPRQMDLADILKRRIEELLDIYQPTKLYIATDGIPSSAKLYQQRQRRFKPASNDFFDSNMISPGTQFMRELEASMRHHIRLWKRRRHLTILYSTDMDEGEGEMKLFKYIKSNLQTIRGNVVVYGQDADIMLLSLILVQSYGFNYGVFIHRPHSKQKDLWEVVDIVLFHKLLAFTSNHHFECFIRTMSLIGNDFLPSLHTMNLLKDLNGNRGIMTKLLDHIRLISSESIEFKEFFIRLLHIFESNEDKYITEYWNVDNTNDMRISYYKRKIGDDYDIQHMCTTYYSMMQWVQSYYMNYNVPDWEYIYPYLYPPFIKDLIHYTHLYKEPTWTVIRNPTTIHEQWIRIMPMRTLVKLLPVELCDQLMKHFNHLMPDEVVLDLEYKDIEWEAIVQVPFFPRSEQLTQLIHSMIK
jgi:5'-3' exonuclease